MLIGQLPLGGLARFKKAQVLNGQKHYGRGFHGSFVCVVQEARRNLHCRSLFGGTSPHRRLIWIKSAVEAAAIQS